MTETPSTTPVSQVEHINPAVHHHRATTFVRPSDLEAGFIASIREHGVLQPVLTIRSSDGSLSVRDGQRRTLAAREADVATIPCYIVDAGDDRALRIIQQIIANDQREAISETERVEAFHQLALEGLSVSAIAKRTGHSRDRVKASVRIAASKSATGALASSGVTLDAALILTDFEGDEDAVAELVQCATAYPDQLPHVAQRIRDNRAIAAVVDAATTSLREQGLRVATEGDAYASLHTLTDATEDADERPPVDEYVHITCPGHAVTVRAWRGDDQARVSVVCTQPEKHHTRYSYGNGTSSQHQSGPMTEEQKAERREVIANNKAWESAEVVRREWLTSFVTRKTLPKDAHAFAVRVVATNGADVDKGRTLAHNFLGVDMPSGFYGNALPEVAATPSRSGHVLLALALAAVEEGTGRHTWRTASDGLTRDYFAQIAAWGYTLSEVEQIVAGTSTDE